MPLQDLDLILNKDAIIATFPASHLAANPEMVEQMYRTYARTHVALGDTERYVDTAFRWIGGGNVGAFIGAVIGNNGEGKTSFQIHLWEESGKRKVFAVPPFSWEEVSDMVDGTAAWTRYMLAPTHPEQAQAVTRIHEEFRKKSLLELAQETARRAGRNADDLLASYEATVAAGGKVGAEVTAERFLDFCAEITKVVQQAGYGGLLVLIDEPEVAARSLGNAQVSYILFEIANGLMQRQGDYGVFLSISETFWASVQTTLPALTARIQSRGCAPRLRDIYGSGFASDLWARYVKEFDLKEIADNVVTKEALIGIGQVASSSRSDLSYGPRTVVSAFRRMVYRYKESATAYSPTDFVDDCLDSEVLVTTEYPTRVLEALRAPEAGGIDKAGLKSLAAFPEGMSQQIALNIGCEGDLLELSRKGTLVRRMGNAFTLRTLLKRDGAATERNELHDTLTEIGDEYAPRPDVFDTARDAFLKHLVPMMFVKRQGQQLSGWDNPENWQSVRNIKVSRIVGAFEQTSKDFPRRVTALAVGPLSAEYGMALDVIDEGAALADMFVQFRLRWNADEQLPEQRAWVSTGNPDEGISGEINLAVDLVGEALAAPRLEEIVGRDLLSPLGLMYLIGKMDARTLSKDHEAEWKAVRDQLLRDLFARLIGESAFRTQIKEQLNHVVPGNPADLLGSVTKRILSARYPSYSTLVKQPQWEGKVDDYTRALKNAEIPLACKRGREPWATAADIAARAFGTNAMNLTGGFFSGFESLIAMRSTERNKVEVHFKLHPLEVAIREKVMSEKPAEPYRINDRECWWKPFDELKSVFLSSGYQLEEILKVVEIGKSRQTFQVSERRGQHVIYCLPVDPDEMKAQLRDKLTTLKEENEAFLKVPGYKSSFNFDQIAEKIESLQDEATFDTIVTRITKAHEQNRERLPGYRDRLTESLHESRSSLKQIADTLLTSREVSSLQTLPTGTSRWCADLSQYIVANLQITQQELKSECEAAIAKVDQASLALSENQPQQTAEKVNLIAMGWTAANELKADTQTIKQKAQAFLVHVRDYDHWRNLLRDSDELHRQLVSMKQDSSHVAKATELIEDLERLWTDISLHLQTRNVNGLASHRQYAEQIQTIDASRKTYVQQLGIAYNSRKERANTFLSSLAIDGRCSESFNPADSKGSYERLYSQAALLLFQVLRSEVAEIEEKQRELTYARDILLRLPQDQSDTLIDSLLANRQALDVTLTELNPNASAAQIILMYLDDAAKHDALKAAIEQSRQAVRAVRVVLKQIDDQHDAAISPEATTMLASVPPTDQVDLKHLVLKAMAKGDGSSEVLETSLASLAELFRQGKVQIKVERPRR